MDIIGVVAGIAVILLLCNLVGISWIMWKGTQKSIESLKQVVADFDTGYAKIFEDCKETVSELSHNGRLTLQKLETLEKEFSILKVQHEKLQQFTHRKIGEGRVTGPNGEPFDVVG